MTTPILFVCLALVGAEPSDLDTKALQKINAYRQRVDLPPVVLDAALSRGCQAHADFLIQHFEASLKGRFDVHDEDPQLPGGTPEGRKAAKASAIARAVGNSNPLPAIDVWLASFYHRINFLDPDLEKIGFGYATGDSHRWTLVVDNKSGKVARKPAGKDLYQVIAYPADDQKPVPLLFSMGFPEVPNPLPNNGLSRNAGHPVTVTFFPAAGARVFIKDASASLTDEAGKEVSAWVSSPERPAVKGYGGTSICVIPQAPLQANTTYKVSVRARVNNQDWSKSWSFQTGRQ